jgi:hypothetical protein
MAAYQEWQRLSPGGDFTMCAAVKFFTTFPDGITKKQRKSVPFSECLYMIKPSEKAVLLSAPSSAAADSEQRYPERSDGKRRCRFCFS